MRPKFDSKIDKMFYNILILMKIKQKMSKICQNSYIWPIVKTAICNKKNLAPF